MCVARTASGPLAAGSPCSPRGPGATPCAVWLVRSRFRGGNKLGAERFACETEFRSEIQQLIFAARAFGGGLGSRSSGSSLSFLPSPPSPFFPSTRCCLTERSVLVSLAALEEAKGGGSPVCIFHSPVGENRRLGALKFRDGGAVFRDAGLISVAFELVVFIQIGSSTVRCHCSPRLSLSPLSTQSVRSAMTWESWAGKAPRATWWCPGRPLRVGTDCSGFGIPELALRELADEHGSTVHTAFACDVAASSQRWLLSAQTLDSPSHTWPPLSKKSLPHCGESSGARRPRD